MEGDQAKTVQRLEAALVTQKREHQLEIFSLKQQVREKLLQAETEKRQLEQVLRAEIALERERRERKEAEQASRAEQQLRRAEMAWRGRRGRWGGVCGLHRGGAA